MTIWGRAAGVRGRAELTGAGECGVVRVMNAAGEFSQLVGAVLARFLAQNGRAGLPAEEGRAVGRRLWAVVAERGLPRALAEGECGVPGGMSEAEVGPLVAAVLGEAGDAELAAAVKQLVKACLYPEFTVCRESYREAAGDGGCKRQELARVRGRVSGTHCVDCPHWVALTPEQHGAMLARAWRVGGAEALAENRGVFLPEDFRALRQWLHARARVAR